MRRGGIVILLIGVIIALAAAGLLFFFLQNSTTVSDETTIEPTREPDVEVIVANVDIPANTLIADQGLLGTREIPESEFDSRYFTNVNDVLGKLAVSNIRADELITQSDITEPGLSQQIPTAEPDRPRPKAYAFSSNSIAGVADQIKPGDFVDIVATFSMPRRISYPTGREVDDQGQVTIERQVTEEFFPTTKTIVQQVQVLRIIRPGVPEEGTPGPEGEQAAEPEVDESGRVVEPEAGDGNTITPGSWLLVLAINDQEAELIEFALNTQSDISLVLRGAGDTDFEPTIGATYDLLVSEFGVPAPQVLDPHLISEEDAFIPNPTFTPAPTRIP